MAKTRLLPETRIEIRPMTGVIGAEVIGLELANADDDTAQIIQNAVLKHRVIAVRDQFLHPESQLRLGAKLGEFTYTRGLVHNTEWPEIYLIENPGKDKALTENWHTDGITSRRPPSFTILAAQKVPAAGGDTLFANQGYAYSRLSAGYKRLLRGLRCHYINTLYDEVNPPRHDHPLVRVIPETGERVLYVGAANESHIDGMTVKESASILAYLQLHAVALDGVYRHRWLPGDVVIWDNRTTMHCAVHDYGEETRTLTRLMIAGEEPYDLPYDE